MDLENQYVELNMHIPRATLMGQYHVTGKIFLITFDERGPVNMTVCAYFDITQIIYCN